MYYLYLYLSVDVPHYMWMEASEYSVVLYTAEWELDDSCTCVLQGATLINYEWEQSSSEMRHYIKRQLLCELHFNGCYWRVGLWQYSLLVFDAVLYMWGHLRSSAAELWCSLFHKITIRCVEPCMDTTVSFHNWLLITVTASFPALPSLHPHLPYVTLCMSPTSSSDTEVSLSLSEAFQHRYCLMFLSSFFCYFGLKVIISLTDK